MKSMNSIEIFDKDKKNSIYEKLRTSSKIKETSVTPKQKNSFNSFSSKITEDYKKIINPTKKDKNIFPQHHKSEKVIYSISQYCEQGTEENDIVNGAFSPTEKKIINLETEKKTKSVSKQNPPIPKKSFKDLRNNYKDSSTVLKTNYNSRILMKEIEKEKEGEVLKNIKNELNEISQCIQNSENKMIKIRSSSTARIRLDKGQNVQSMEMKKIPKSKKKFSSASSNPQSRIEMNNLSISKKNLVLENEKTRKDFYFNQYEIEEDSLFLNCREKLSKQEDDKEIENLQSKIDLKELKEENQNLKNKIESMNKIIGKYFPTSNFSNFEILFACKLNLQTTIWYLIKEKNPNCLNTFWMREEDLKNSEINFDKNLEIKSLNEIIDLKIENELHMAKCEIEVMKNSIYQLNILNTNLNENILKSKQDLEDKIKLTFHLENGLKNVNEKLQFYMNEFFNLEIKNLKESRCFDEEKILFGEKITLMENQEKYLQNKLNSYEEECSIYENKFIKAKFNEEEKEKLKIELENEHKKNSVLNSEIKNLHEQIENIPNVIKCEAKKLKIKLKIESDEKLNLHIEENKILEGKNLEFLSQLEKIHESYSGLEEINIKLHEENKNNFIQIEMLNHMIESFNLKQLEEKTSQKKENNQEKIKLEAVINNLKDENEKLNFRLYENLEKKENIEFEICHMQKIEILSVVFFSEKFDKEICRSEEFEFININDDSEKYKFKIIHLEEINYLNNGLQTIFTEIFDLENFNFEFTHKHLSSHLKFEKIKISPIEQIQFLSIETKCEELKKRLVDISHLEKENKILNQKITLNEEKISELQLNSNHIEETFLAEISKLKQNHEEKLSKFQSTIEFYEKQIEDYKTKFSYSNIQLEEINLVNKNLKIENEKILNEINNLTENNKQLSDEELEGRLVIQELEMRIEKLDEEIEQLTNKNLKLSIKNSKNLKDNFSESQLSLKILNEAFREELKKKEDSLFLLKEEMTKIEFENEKANEKLKIFETEEENQIFNTNQSVSMNFSEACVMTENSYERRENFFIKKVDSFLFDFNINPVVEEEDSSITLEEKIEKYKRALCELNLFSKNLDTQMGVFYSEMKKRKKNSGAGTSNDEKIKTYNDLRKLITEILDYYNPPYV